MFLGQLYANEDWWAVWSGFIFLTVSVLVSCLSTSLRAPLPEPWSSPSESFHVDSFFGFVVVISLAAAVGALGRRSMKRAQWEKAGTLEARAGDEIVRPFLRGFAALSLVGVAAQWVGSQVRRCCSAEPTHSRS